jgi:predicted chitinase
MITAAQLKAIAGAGAKPALVAAIVNGWANAVVKARLSTKLRACHFLAQIMTETGGLRILEESGAYSAKRMVEIFGVGHHSARITEPEARKIASLPAAQRGPVLFNRVYGVGNPAKMREFNNTGANDGWLYRGGGMMQATGKSNYAIMEKKTGLPLVAHPELLHQPDGAFTAAYLEWAQDSRCNVAADRDDVVAVRKIINGGSNGLTACRSYLARAKGALTFHDAAPQSIVAEPEPEADEDQTAAQPPAAPDVMASTPPADASEVQGDAVLFLVQKRLKAMHYSPGVVTGTWGGMTAGAISGFLNDRHSALPAPTSLAMFDSAAADIGAELRQAEAEAFTRPVTAARASGDLATVAKVAPEVLPVHHNFLLTVWAAITTFVTGLINSASDSIARAFDFLTDHKDDLPSDPGVLSGAWDYVRQLPALVWFVLAAAAIGWVAFNSWKGVRKITEQVQTGARQ